jgi:Family of unknown function (DUF6176)
MLETRCVKIKLKPDSLERVREWAAEINRRADEALATLRDEGVVVESVFLDSNSEGDFLIYYMKAESFEKSADVVKKSTHAIDAYHQKFMKEVCETGHRLELLVDLDRIGEVSSDNQ